MTNIYKLIFPNDTRVYVGKTYKDINIRLQEHLSSLKSGTHNRKLQSAYPACGDPTVHLLEVCDSTESSKVEAYWIEKLNSFNEGFNGNKGGWGGTSLPGASNPSALYTEDDYMCALVCLARTDWSIREIANELEMKYDTIIGISARVICKHLKDVLPEEWEMLSSKNRRKTSHSLKYYPDIIGPDGTIYKISSISEFARTQGISRSKINEVINGRRNQVSGYRVC